MKTQSPDTSIDAELALIGMLRRATVARRFAIVQGLVSSVFAAGCEYIRQLYPQVSDEEARLLFIERKYGKPLVDQIRQSLSMYDIHTYSTPRYREAIEHLVRTCETAGITYALWGSLISSIYGMQRATLQIDIIVDLDPEDLLSFFEDLGPLYLFDKEEIKALPQKTVFTLVHLESLFKVVITLPEMLRGGRDLLDRARELVLTPDTRPVLALGPEQMILLYLEVFKKSKERADDYWYDLLGVLKVQGHDLDLSYLTEQAIVSDLSELLDRTLVDAGI